jgi:hypothetical protein
MRLILMALLVGACGGGEDGIEFVWPGVYRASLECDACVLTGCVTVDADLTAHVGGGMDALDATCEITGGDLHCTGLAFTRSGFTAPVEVLTAADADTASSGTITVHEAGGADQSGTVTLVRRVGCP